MLAMSAPPRLRCGLWVGCRLPVSADKTVMVCGSRLPLSHICLARPSLTGRPRPPTNREERQLGVNRKCGSGDLGPPGPPILTVGMMDQPRGDPPVLGAAADL